MNRPVNKTDFCAISPPEQEPSFVEFGRTIPSFFSPWPEFRRKLHNGGIVGSREANDGASVKADDLVSSASSNWSWFQNQGACSSRQHGTARSGLNEGGRGLAMGANRDRRVLVDNSRGPAGTAQLGRSTSSRDLPLGSAWFVRVLLCCGFATKPDWCPIANPPMVETPDHNAELRP